MKRKIDELNNFYIFLAGQFVSQFGSRMTSYALVLWAYGKSGSVLSAAMLSICYLVPEVLLNFIAGSMSEGWHKKKVLLVSDSIAALLSVSVLGLLLMDKMEIVYLYGINFILGVTDAFQRPASEVTISLIISRENYMKTSGFQSFFDAFTTIFYPVVTTMVYAVGGLKGVLVIDIATFIFAAVTLAFWVKIPHIEVEEQDESVKEKCINGIKYLLDEKGLGMLILFMAFINLIVAIYNTNLAPMVLCRSHNNEMQLGLVSAMVGVGGLIGSFFVARVKEDSKRVLMCIRIIAFSFLICNGLLGIGRNFYVWMGAVFLGNVLIPIFSANVGYIMRTHVPIAMQGRVFSARNTLQYMTIPLGNFLGGVLADQVFEPFMMQEGAKNAMFLKVFVGSGKGSGIGLLFVVIAIVGFIGSYLFMLSHSFMSLDNEVDEVS